VWSADTDVADSRTGSDLPDRGWYPGPDL